MACGQQWRESNVSNIYGGDRSDDAMLPMWSLLFPGCVSELIIMFHANSIVCMLPRSLT